MKNILFLVSILIGTSTIGQVVLLNENFNNGIPSNFSMIDNDGLTPNSNPNVSHLTNAFNLVEDYDSTGIGDSILAATSWFETAGEADDYLILPEVILGQYGNYISFDAKSIDASYPDGIQVLYSTTDTLPSTFLSNDTIYDTIASGYWKNYVVSLDSAQLTGQSVRIALRHYGNDQFVLGLDNIKVWINDPIGIQESIVEQAEVTQVGNREFSVNGNFYNFEYTIRDINGKLIQQGSSNNLINLTGNAGVYFIYVNGRIAKKVAIL